MEDPVPPQSEENTVTHLTQDESDNLFWLLNELSQGDNIHDLAWLFYLCCPDIEISETTLTQTIRHAREPYMKFLRSDTFTSKQKQKSGAIRHSPQSVVNVETVIVSGYNSLIEGGIKIQETPREEIQNTREEVAQNVLVRMIIRDYLFIIARGGRHRRMNRPARAGRMGIQVLPKELNPLFSYFVYYILEGNETSSPYINAMLEAMRERVPFIMSPDFPDQGYPYIHQMIPEIKRAYERSLQQGCEDME